MALAGNEGGMQRMWSYVKQLEYPVRIKTPNPAAAKVILDALGGADGELSASTRYLAQRFGMPNDQIVGILTDIGISASVLFTLYLGICRKVPFSGRIFYGVTVFISGRY